jgi:hypothetical protein
MHLVLGTAPNTPSALLAIADEVIDETARLRCWPHSCVCDAACCGAAAKVRRKSCSHDPDSVLVCDIDLLGRAA